MKTSAKSAPKSATAATATDELDAALELVAKSLGITVPALRIGSAWVKKSNEARSRIGSIKAKLAQVGESSHRVAGKATQLVEGIAYDISTLPDADKKLLSGLVKITKAAEILNAK